MGPRATQFRVRSCLAGPQQSATPTPNPLPIEHNRTIKSPLSTLSLSLTIHPTAGGKSLYVFGFPPALWPPRRCTVGNPSRRSPLHRCRSAPRSPNLSRSGRSLHPRPVEAPETRPYEARKRHGIGRFLADGMDGKRWRRAHGIFLENPVHFRGLALWKKWLLKMKGGPWRRTMCLLFRTLRSRVDP